MKQQPRTRKTMVLRTEAQRRAFVSPLRMELMGLFIDGTPLAVAEIAESMGRPASAIHYHVRVLEQAGLLKRSGKRTSGRRPQALYLPAAEVFQLEQPRSNPGDAALKTMAMAFRMAERDMKAALENPTACTDGPQRNTLGARMHCRLSKKELAELNRHLRSIEKMLTRSRRSHRPAPDDQFVSLTVALLPLRDREVSS